MSKIELLRNKASKTGMLMYGNVNKLEVIKPKITQAGIYVVHASPSPEVAIIQGLLSFF